MICDEFGVNVMKYELRTLKDVFDKVPIDRIGDCMKEIGIEMIQAKAMLGLMNIVAESEASVFQFPESTAWIDDGKNEIGVSFYETCNEKEFLRVETKLCKDSDV